MILTLALAPMRVAPAASMFFRSSSVRIPPGRLHAHLRAHHPAHQRDIMNGGAVSAETGGGLDELRAGELRQRAGHGFLIVVEKRGFQNHLHDRAALMRRRDHGLNIPAHGVVVSAPQLADIQHHVDFLRARARPPPPSPPP